MHFSVAIKHFSFAFNTKMVPLVKRFCAIAYSYLCVGIFNFTSINFQSAVISDDLLVFVCVEQWLFMELTDSLLESKLL